MKFIRKRQRKSCMYFLPLGAKAPIRHKHIEQLSKEADEIFKKLQIYARKQDGITKEEKGNEQGILYEDLRAN